MCTENSEVALSDYPEAQHYFLTRTIRAVQLENARLVQLGKAQKYYYEGREQTLKDRIKELEKLVVETLKLY